MILLDTSVVSELMKVEPDPAVITYLTVQAPETLFTAAICKAEIRYGLARMPASRKRDNLVARVVTFFETGFRDRILSFDSSCAVFYAEIRHARELAGLPIEVEDAMIAATARTYGAIIATRRTKDFIGCGVAVVDPWRGA
ncbi:type II toxin-antitoxin system VapC family toxin [Beijerinckia indica]|uniref:Ribonuclease VapC n=1 Tax=Beijerinckia indica subsp. indica (strain ATCC 9039 / DSM 1715 / NCIMB 8712) TaxID=395963 RepID=B2IJY9_BEII9|nr:type II toxin-antitoxin system VapC family toxin [Beijerinckia indica]ACB96364.1 PilT protein domain protein [Beijerinckia indica subsp. indica ATCC 9039]